MASATIPTRVASFLWKLPRKRWFKISLVCLLILLPFIVSKIYEYFTALPSTVRIAIGSEGGMYRQLSNALATRMEKELGIENVVRVPSMGSLDNILKLQSGQVDFALYQPGTFQIIKKLAPNDLKRGQIENMLPSVSDPGPVEFIANLYSQPAHLFVRRGSGIKVPLDLIGRRVAFGLELSGDHAMSLALLYYYRLDGTVEAEPLNYKQIEAEFLRKAPSRDGKPLDAAIITVGEQAPVLERLARSEACYIIDLPEVEALCRKYVFFYPHEIPQGIYSRNPLKIPEKRVHTVAAGAHLLSREGVSTSLVEEVTRIVLNKKFATENGLGELFHGEREFARRQPSFPVHTGATNIYEPDLRPPLNADFVESLAGMQSFFFAVVIAIFLGIRWLVRRRARRQEHKLDRFMKKILLIEANQIPLDSRGGSDDIEVLNGLLDQVTMLRQEVLRDISAHEVTEDRAVECFINMCHALSNKISAKITRQRFDHCFKVSPSEGRSNGRARGHKARKRKKPKGRKKRSIKR